MPPLVSVIIPCYRQGHFLAGAIDSALAQTYPSVEVVVVDDGSDDNTDEVATRYSGKLVYVRKSNGGLSSARNAGLETARGEYVLFLDADDLLPSTAVADLVDALPTADALVIGGHSTFTHNPTTDAGPSIQPPSSPPLPQAFEYNLAPVHCWLSPRQAIDEVGRFDTSLRSLEDWHLWLRLLLSGRPVATIQQVVAYYRLYPGSMSTNRERMFQMRLRVMDDLLDWVGQNRDLWNKWGVAVFSPVRDTVRACLAKGVYPTEAAATYARLRRRYRGCLGGQSLTSWMIREGIGYTGERAVLFALRLLRPSLYQRYAQAI